jgi:ABC-type transport system involved in multi-copper enzyme maturation permease subunit
MKFLAILKDSLREALDTWVFYVMVGISLLTILLIGHIAYRPVSVEEAARRNIAGMNWLLQRTFDRAKQGADKGNQADKGKKAEEVANGPPPAFDVEDFEQTNPDAAQPWQTGYRFYLTLRFEDEKKAKAMRFYEKLPLVGKKTASGFERQFQTLFPYLKNIKVTDAEPKSPTEMRYLVTADSTSRYQDWPHYPVVFFAVPIRGLHFSINNFVQFWESWLINWIGAAVALLLSTIITAFFIPNMLRKGTVDLLLAKPISRPALLLYKYIGGLLFIFLNTVIVIVGIWLVLGLRTNLWGVGFLLSIPVLTFQFAMYYAVSTLFAVLSRSPIVAILMTCLCWFVFAVIVGQLYSWIDKTRNLREIMEAQVEAGFGEMPPEGQMLEKPFPDWVYTTADIVHLVTPHLKDLDTLTDKWILDDVLPADSRDRKLADKLFENFQWTETIMVTSFYIVALLAFSCWWFARKDY